ncbi:MAG: hypothetical protein WCT20_01020 [Candidatus Babeliales bacterium]
MMRFLRDTHVICLIYDGIKNSVFKSQVLQPLLAELDANKGLKITLISFERNAFNSQDLVWHDRLSVIILNRWLFFGRLSLVYAFWQCKKVLKGVVADCILARGPLAGAIALDLIAGKRLKTTRCIIQARGLCAEEYRYAMRSKTSLSQRIRKKFVYHELEQLERCVYGKQRKNIGYDITIEAVSPALKDYLVDRYQAEEKSIVIAYVDLPCAIIPATRALFRRELRRKLGIAEDARVYCYSGSYKPWQGVKESLDYFCHHASKDAYALLLILSPDQNQFDRELKSYGLSPHHYRILNVDPCQVLTYLCAADYGFLFRDNDCINWVSRPTKMLEYQAAGLSIIHNHTVAWLCQ